MARDKRDQNFIPVGSGVSSADSTTTVQFRVDPVTQYLLATLYGDNLTCTSATKNKRDVNFRPTMYGIANTDLTTLLPIRMDSNGRLLCQIT